MAFKLPSLEKSKPNPLPSVLGDNFPLFSWNELFEKEDPIGRGSFASVFVAKRQPNKTTASHSCQIACHIQTIEHAV